MAKKVCIITGAGQGIGKALALGFALDHYHLAVVDISPTSAMETVKEIQSRGGSASAHPVDITSAKAVNTSYDDIEKRHGCCSVLINNARWGGLKPTATRDITDEDWLRTFDVNVNGAFYWCRAVLKGMVASKFGRIINMSSSTVRQPPNKPYAHYISTKAALIGLTRALAKEHGPDGITANAVLPGSVDTGLTRLESFSSSEREIHALATQSIPRVITSQDVVGICMFLASDASSFITGQSISVDGGASFS